MELSINTTQDYCVINEVNYRTERREDDLNVITDTQIVSQTVLLALHLIHPIKVS